MLKNTFLFIFSDLEIIFSLYSVCLYPEILFTDLWPFSKNGNQIGDMVPILPVKTFYWHSKWNKMEHFGIIAGFYTKKLVWDEIFNIFHKSTHISFNIGLRMLNLHTLGHPFPSAGHIYSIKYWNPKKEEYWSIFVLPTGCKCHEISGCFGDTVTISCGPGDRKINILGDFYGLSPPDAEPKVCGYSNKDVCVVPSHSHSSVAKQVRRNSASFLKLYWTRLK